MNPRTIMEQNIDLVQTVWKIGKRSNGLSNLVKKQPNRNGSIKSGELFGK